jgi:hypothetical protein
MQISVSFVTELVATFAIPRSNRPTDGLSICFNVVAWLDSKEEEQSMRLQFVGLRTHRVRAAKLERRVTVPDSGFVSARGGEYSDSGIHTVSDYPLLIGEILRRNELRYLRRAKRKAFVQRIGRALGIEARPD